MSLCLENTSQIYSALTHSAFHCVNPLDVEHGQSIEVNEL